MLQDYVVQLGLLLKLTGKTNNFLQNKKLTEWQANPLNYNIFINFCFVCSLSPSMKTVQTHVKSKNNGMLRTFKLSKLSETGAKGLKLVGFFIVLSQNLSAFAVSSVCWAFCLLWNAIQLNQLWDQVFFGFRFCWRGLMFLMDFKSTKVRNMDKKQELISCNFEELDAGTAKTQPY